MSQLLKITKQAKKVSNKRKNKRKLNNKNEPKPKKPKLMKKIKKSATIQEQINSLDEHLSQQKSWKFGYVLPPNQQKERSVLKFTNLPRGMEEYQIYTFFKQFGHITRYALKRTKMGKPQGICYVEFDGKDVDVIIKEAMDDTYIDSNKLECEIIDYKDVKPEFWKTNDIKELKSNKNIEFHQRYWNRVSIITNLIAKYPEFYKNIIDDEIDVNNELKKHNIDYQFWGIRDSMNKTMLKEMEQDLHELNVIQNIDAKDAGKKAETQVKQSKVKKTKSKKPQNKQIKDAMAVKVVELKEDEQDFLN